MSDQAAASSLDEHVRQLVDQAPPLTSETRARLAVLLAPSPAQVPDRSAAA